VRKEEILKELQELLLTLQKNGQKMVVDSELAKSFTDRSDTLSIEMKGLNSCDACWVNDQYGKWFNRYIAPKYQKLINQIKMHGPEMKARLKEMGLNIP
jgi:hypothetical protein